MANSLVGDPQALQTAESVTSQDLCQEAEVPFFFKQWGGRTPKAAGRELDGVVWNEMPEHASAAG
jgi:protein gp37